MASEEYTRINERLDKIERLVTIGSKDLLTVEDLCLLTGFSQSRIYKLTLKREIPYYKPLGGKLFFDKVEIENWLRSNKIETNAVTKSKAATYCITHK